MAHAARMRRYRQRRENVTHHPSAEPTADALLIATSTTSAIETTAMMATTPSLGHCRFCLPRVNQDENCASIRMRRLAGRHRERA
jgi:hypothetical protein